jgi:glycyl-tRNA synthetase
MPASTQPDVMDKLVSLCKRRGFIFQSSEIYGGTGSVWDYGPLGVELKKNLKDQWWKAMVRMRDDVAGLDAAILMHPRVWEASGHVAGFTDPLVDCKTCKSRFRADKLEDARCPQKPSKRPGEAEQCQLTEPRMFNLMFKTFMGPLEESASTVYLRPETAQGIFVNFLNVQQSMRQKVPFGIAQIGKAFRNEITPGNFIFRTREFEQMELQFFVEPGEDMKWFEYWKAERMAWHQSLGLAPERLNYHQHTGAELAHYARAAFDIEFDFGGTLGFQEIEGIHNRGDFDLSRHQEFSGKKLEYFDQPNNKRYLPCVIETSVGADRSTLAALVNAYREETVDGEDEGRTVLRLHSSLAPIKAAVFALTKKEGMPDMAHRIANELRPHFPVDYDETGSIGKRYRRQDEVGTPFCVTVDPTSVQDGTVTVRDRDTLKQDRISADALLGYLRERLPG